MLRHHTNDRSIICNTPLPFSPHWPYCFPRLQRLLPKMPTECTHAFWGTRDRFPDRSVPEAAVVDVVDVRWVPRHTHAKVQPKSK